MDRLAKRIRAIYPDVDLKNSVIVQDDSDGSGAYIKQWDDPRPQPTEAELVAVVLP